MARFILVLVLAGLMAYSGYTAADQSAIPASSSLAKRMAQIEDLSR